MMARVEWLTPTARNLLNIHLKNISIMVPNMWNPGLMSRYPTLRKSAGRALLTARTAAFSDRLLFRGLMPPMAWQLLWRRQSTRGSTQHWAASLFTKLWRLTGHALLSFSTLPKDYWNSARTPRLPALISALSRQLSRTKASA